MARKLNELKIHKKIRHTADFIFKITKCLTSNI